MLENLDEQEEGKATLHSYEISREALSIRKAGCWARFPFVLDFPVIDIWGNQEKENAFLSIKCCTQQHYLLLLGLFIYKNRIKRKVSILPILTI